MKWHGVGASHVGRVRQVNEDEFAIDQARQFFVVADGMGGHAGGGLASRIAVRTIMSPAQLAYLDQSLGSADQIHSALQITLESANQAIRAYVKEHPDLTGMGTTATLAWIPPTLTDQAVIANLGDSRAYQLRKGALTQISRDHSWVLEQIQRGFLSPKDARTHPMRHALTRALGMEAIIRPDLFTVQLLPGDRLVLCTDGLTKMLTDEQILEQLLSPARAPEEQCQALIDEANRLGGKDNVTVVVIGEKPEC